jgi:glucosamine kinase
MKNIFIGIDGGGTKTRVLIEDEVGNKIGEGIGGPSNIRLSVENAWKSIYDAIAQALDGTGVNLENDQYNFHAGMGLAGVSIIEAKKQFLDTANPFKTLILESDAHIACLGANKGNDGAIISIGTGVIGYLINNKHYYRVSGWGFPHADTAGGAWFGMEITRLTFSWIDGCISASPVLEKVLTHFDNDISKFVQWANTSNASQFATLAPYVVKGLAYNDPNSVKLFEQAAVEVDLLIKALFNKSKNSELQLMLLGGLATFIKPFLQFKKISVNQDKDAAIKGAQYLIREDVNL